MRASRSRTRCARTGSCSASRVTPGSATLLEAATRDPEDGHALVVTDFATAELVKVAANSFLATKISFINAMAEVCEVTGADVTQLAEAIGHDERIGHRFLHAGLGFGAAACQKTSVRSWRAPANWASIRRVAFLKSVDEINLRRRARMVDLAREMCDGITRRPAGWCPRRGVQAEQRRHP